VEEAVMPVTNDEIAALRAHLQGNQALQQELYARISTPDAKARYTTLLAMAFFEAVSRRFGGRDSAAGVIEYVAEVRARGPEVGEKIDPGAAERVIRRALTDDVDVSDISDGMRGRIFLIFVLALVSDAEYDDDQLEAFLVEARKAADDALEH
jgi:hypothetical protein